MSALVCTRKVPWAAVVAIVLAGCSRPVAPPAPPSGGSLAMGNPSRAGTSDRDNYLLDKTHYALSYSDRTGTANWVSWRLTAADMGEAERGDFYPDDTLPAGFTRVTPSDYTDSGFDRGHLCPHGDRDATQEMSESTFAMTNVMPQAPRLNRGPWAQLEEYSRELAEEGKVLHIVCGPAGRGGEGSRGRRNEIGREATVTVPAQCWKVVMVLDGGGGDDVERVNGHTRLLAVIMPNEEGVGEDWTAYRVSVAEVERLTGYTFFDRAPASVIGPRKREVDDTPIPDSQGGEGG